MVKEQSRVLLVAKVQPKLCVQAPEKLVFSFTEACLRLLCISTTRWFPPPISNGHCPTDRITKNVRRHGSGTANWTTVIDTAGQPWHYKSDKGKFGNVYSNNGDETKGTPKRKWNPPYCGDCGSNFHRRRDAKCNDKSFQTKKRIKLAAEAKKIEDSEEGNNDGNHFFLTGSDRKGN